MKLLTLLTSKTFLLGIGVLLIVSGLVSLTLENVINNHILVLRENNILYHYWQKIPADIQSDFYFFNWTNPHDIDNKSVKPKFEEVGPYKYRQTVEKVNITWNNNGTVSYRNLRYWYYDDKNKNNGNLDDLITSINPIATTLSKWARDWNYFVRKGLSFTISTIYPKIYLKRRVRDLLFDGYEDPLLKILHTIPMLQNLLSAPKLDRFGWVYRRNGSAEDEGLFTMGTGINSSLGQIYLWNYLDKTTYFGGRCSKIEGYAGELNPRDLEKHHLLVYFIPDMRRTITFQYIGRKKVQNVEGLIFRLGEYALDNGTLHPENKCFCEGECLPLGVFNISASRNNAPVFSSFPHFHRADSLYAKSIEGMQPDKNKHEMTLTIEPITGIFLEADINAQLNFWLQPIPNILLYERVPKVMIPVLWTRQFVTIPKNIMFLLKILTFVFHNGKIMGIVMLLSSLIPLSLFYFYHKKCFASKINKKIKKHSIIGTISQERVPLTNI